MIRRFVIRVLLPLLSLLVTVPVAAQSGAGALGDGPRVGRVLSGARTGGAIALMGDAPLRIEELALGTSDEALPVFVARGTRRATGFAIFLHGMCSRPTRSLAAFAEVLRERVTIVAPQGDVACDDGSFRWSDDPSLLSRRIDDALTAAGYRAGDSVVFIGYSQGAERIERLAAFAPAKYTRAILMSGPVVPAADRMRGVTHAAFVIGGNEGTPMMRAAYEEAQARGGAAFFGVLPDATHGSLGSRPHAVLNRALDVVLGCA